MIWQYISVRFLQHPKENGASKEGTEEARDREKAEVGTGKSLKAFSLTIPEKCRTEGFFRRGFSRFWHNRHARRRALLSVAGARMPATF